jgi:hypothetical protein
MAAAAPSASGQTFWRRSRAVSRHRRSSLGHRSCRHFKEPVSTRSLHSSAGNSWTALTYFSRASWRLRSKYNCFQELPCADTCKVQSLIRGWSTPPHCNDWMRATSMFFHLACARLCQYASSWMSCVASAAIEGVPAVQLPLSNPYRANQLKWQVQGQIGDNLLHICIREVLEHWGVLELRRNNTDAKVLNKRNEPSDHYALSSRVAGSPRLS